jgi:predicted ester cyclase
MAAEDAGAVVPTYLEAIRRRQGLRHLLADTVLFEAPGSWSLRGAREVERAVRHHYEVEFDAAPELVGLVADGRAAVAEVVFAGRHIGEYDGVAATGAAVRLPLAMAFEVEQGLIEAIRVYYSPELLRGQLVPGAGTS